MKLSFNLPPSFVLHRLFSLSGAVLVFYFFYHLFIHGGRFLPFNDFFSQSFFLARFFHWGLLFVIFFHAFSGVALLQKGRGNLIAYSYADNWRFSFQYGAGFFTMVFLIYHIVVMRFAEGEASVDTLWFVHQLETPWKVIVYMLGTLAASFYATNGIWNFLVSWGVLVNAASRGGCLKICRVGFVGLTLVQWLIIARFVYHYQVAPVWLKMFIK